VIGSAIFVICAIGFREKPPTPPSSTEATETGNVWLNIKSVFQNKNAMIAGLVFGLVMGVMNTYGTIMGIIADTYGYTPGNISLFGAIFIVGGIIGSGVFGGIVEVFKNYKKALIAIALMTVVSPIGLLFGLLSMKVWLATIASFIVGFSSVSVLPVGIDFGVELTHPIGEAISTGV